MSASAASRWLPDVGNLFDRVVYTTQQRSLALSLGVGGRIWSQLLAPTQPPPSTASLLELQQRFDSLLQRDLDNVRRGAYPRELLYQFPLTEYLWRLPEALTDVPRFLWRSYRGNFADVPEADAGLYPEYYRRTFHWQTDGWFSSRSARLYDASVEFLFGGTADVMRRMAVPPITEFAADHPAPLRILDIGCGTGRFLRQLGRALPDARLYGLDLSKHYLGEARRNFAHEVDVSFVVENAESIPFADEHFDVVTSVFMLHELPKPVRRRVLREAARVLRAGGLLVLCDSAQVSDSAGIEDILLSFPRSYHEPFYRGYLTDDLGALLRSVGLAVESSEPHLVSKVVVGRKPQGSPGRRR